MSSGDASRWYSSARWQRLRANQLLAHPLCIMCLDEQRYIAATVADHVTPHKGDYAKFWEGDLQSLCAPHHNSDKKLIEAGKRPRLRISSEGWPER